MFGVVLIISKQIADKLSSQLKKKKSKWLGMYVYGAHTCVMPSKLKNKNLLRMALFFRENDTTFHEKILIRGSE